MTLADTLKALRNYKGAFLIRTNYKGLGKNICLLTDQSEIRPIRRESRWSALEARFESFNTETLV